MRPRRVASLRPMLRTVSIMPGMETRAPERQETSSGFFGSPNVAPMTFSVLARSANRPPGRAFGPGTSVVLLLLLPLLVVLVVLLPFFVFLIRLFLPLLVPVALLFLLVLALLLVRRRGLLGVDLIRELPQVLG